MQKFVPVLSNNNKPLMPTTPMRARQLLKSSRAVKRWFKGVFAIKLIDTNNGDIQEIVVGLDPGSKREGFTVKSYFHTYLNIQTEATDYVKDKIKTRREMRRNRRNRNTPYRKCRLNKNRNKKFLSPSTKARWQAKLRILNYLNKIFPLKLIIVEDIKARTFKKARKWNLSFSPLQVGKNWFYSKIKEKWKLILRNGYETKEKRDELGLKKKSNKLSVNFYSHCVDSWVLANSYIEGHHSVDNEEVIVMNPIKFIRRQLHNLKFSKNSIRSRRGGTLSLGLKRGSVVKHVKYGICYVGGHSNNRVSLHAFGTGKRLSQFAKLDDIKFLAYNSWK